MKELLQTSFVSIETDARYTEAAVRFHDDSILYFCHRVGERWAKGVGPDGVTGGRSQELLGAIESFRLNAKHLEILFDDGSRWEWIPGEE